MLPHKLKCAVETTEGPSPMSTRMEEHTAMQNMPLHHVVIVGGGFGGLYAARALRRAPVRVTLID